MMISLELDSETPLYEQLYNQVILGIASGRLAAGDRLPAVRQLADELGINMMTVNKAYTLLKQKGYIVIDRRHGAQISARFETADALSPSLEKQLSLIIAQVKIHGIDQNQFTDICQRIYAAMSKSP